MIFSLVFFLLPGHSLLPRLLDTCSFEESSEQDQAPVTHQSYLVAGACDYRGCHWK